jgi:GAF domain-containing protein
LKWEEVETAPEFQGLWQREKEDFGELDTRIIVGIKIQNELIGIILLARKISGDPYTADDREMLITLGNLKPHWLSKRSNI